MMWGYGGMGLWGSILMTISTVLFLVLIIYGAVALVRYLDRGDRGRAGSQGRSAEELLASRFAVGEIDEQEYRRRLEVLRERTQPVPRN